MSEQIILRAYQKTDQKALENVVREAWKYDRFCSPKTAAKMAKVYLNSYHNRYWNNFVRSFWNFEHREEKK